MQPVTYNFSRSNRVLDLFSLGSFALFLYPFLMTVGTGLRWLEIPGTEWIKSYGAEDISLFWLYLAAAVFSGALFGYFLVFKSPTRNLLEFDDAGLTYAFLGMRRQWPWRDLQSAAVLDRPFGMKAGRLIISGTFDWKARLGLLLTNGLAFRDRLVVMLPDFYGTPIADIVAKLNEFRDQASGTRRPDKSAVRTLPRVTARPGDSIAYVKSKARYTQERMTLYIVLVITGLVMVPMAAVVYLLIEEQPDFGSVYTASVLLLGLAAVMWPILFVVEFRNSKPKNNSLALDGDGLTYTRRRQVHKWSWQTLSAFETKTAPTIIARRFITFAAPGKDWSWWWLRLINGFPGKPPAVLIEDIYETSLEDITATLNAHRERATGGTAEP